MRLGTLKVSNMWDVFLLLVWGAAWWVGWGQGVCSTFKFVHVYMCYCVQLIGKFQKEVDTSVFCPLNNAIKPGT